MAGKAGPDQKAVDELVKRYLLDKVKEQSGADEKLLDSVLAIHELAEQRETSHDSAQRLSELRDSPMIRTAMAFMGARFQKLADVGVRIAQDTQLLRKRLRERLAEKGIDPLDPRQAAAAEAEYERALADTIPIDTALENVQALAEMVDLANDVLNQEGLKKHMYELAWQGGKRMLFKDDAVLSRMEEVKKQLQGDRSRLDRVAKLIRKVGPGVVREAYERGKRAADGAAPARKSASGVGKAAAPKTGAKKTVKAAGTARKKTSRGSSEDE